MEPLVSVVTPVYNEERYLAECIESVINQSYRNWEYTIVDNCSTDRSFEIAQTYARRDPRIRILRNDSFLPQARHHNRALEQISQRSVWVKMVLGDDWIFRECLREMVAVGELSPRIGVVAAYRMQGCKVGSDGLPYSSHVVSGREIGRLHLLTDTYVLGSQNSVLFRADIVRGRRPFFNDKSIHFDVEAIYDLLQSWDFGFVHQVLTFTRTENASLSTGIRGFNQVLLNKLILVKKYGRSYLGADEHERLLRKVECAYYRYLGRNLLRRRGPAFWTYHRNGMQTAGESIRRSRVAGCALLALLDLAFQPKMVLLGLRRRLSRGRA